MASAGPSERPAGSEPAVPRNILSELQQLPRARAFPPLLGMKRARDPAATAGADAGAAYQLSAHAALFAAKPKQLQQPLDPTGLLLMEAANQLNNLVKVQLQRRMLRLASRGRGVASASDSESECEDEEAAAVGSPGSLHAAASDAAASVGGLSSTGGAPSVAASLPESAPISLSRCKRLCLERQYAIDLSGHCIMDGVRVPLPPPDALELKAAAPSQGAALPRAASA
ncbi:hypothetical protein ABPG75_002398 [Micractinium tetrahymenae]